MIIVTATSNASSAFHQHAACRQAAAPVPAITGAIALGSVRGRAPSTHWAKLATGVIVAWPNPVAWRWRLRATRLNPMEERLSKVEIPKNASREPFQPGARRV